MTTGGQTMSDAESIVLEFWRRMNTNEWALAAALFSEDIAIFWPQSNEMITSAENFVAINDHYPAAGPWTFTLERIIGAGHRAATETRVSDGDHEALALSLFECVEDRIHRITEYWPEPYAAPQWRREWVEPIAV